MKFSRLLILTTTLLSAMACAKKHSAPASDPCESGLSQTSCGVELKGHALWKWAPMGKLVPSFRDEDLAGDLDDESAANPKLKENEFDVYWEFSKDDSGKGLARRFVTVRTPKHTLTTVESGSVMAIDNQKFSFVVESSSCENITQPSKPETLYYLRMGDDSLKVDTAPIERPKPVSLSNFLGDVVGQMMTAPIEGMFQGMTQALESLAGMNSFMYNAHGDFTAVRAPVVFGAIGCFGPISNHFQKSQMQMESWNSNPPAR